MSEAPVSSRPRLKGVEGLRAVAALSVLAYHVGLVNGYSRSGPLAPLVAELKAGVVVFFVISGLVLYLPYARATADREPWPDWRAFARRRLTRIMPAYWVALTVMALAFPTSGVIGPNGWRHYLLAQIYDPNTLAGGLPVAWSLAVEVTFYLALPFLALGLRALALRVGARSPAGRQLAALAALGAASVAVRAVLAGSILGPVGKGGYVDVTALPGCLDWFALGMGLAILKAQVEPEVARMHFAVRLAERPAMCAAAACGLFGVAAVLEPRDLFVTVYGPLVHVLMGVAAALLVLPLALGNGLRHSRLRAWITSPRMIWLGTISYGIYLWHMIVLDLIGGGELTPPVTPAPLAHAAGLLVLVAAGAIACGALSWYLVERPAGRLVARRSALLAARATA